MLGTDADSLKGEDAVRLILQMDVDLLWFGGIGTYIKTADQTQEVLEQITPKKWLKTAHHLLILHGRYTCKSQKPMCDQCVITKHCLYLKNEKN